MRRISLAGAVVAVFILTLLGLALGYLTSEPASSSEPFMDTDGDGCSDLEELGSDPTVGGARRPNYRWDFYDPSANGSVDLFDDILEIAYAFGQGPGGPDYSVAKDRSSPQSGMEVWDLGPPDGNIGLFDDILGAAFQFGHTCDGKAEFPEALAFLTGVSSLDALEQLINGDFAPILQAQMIAGQGGGGIAAGQTFPGGYTIVCVYADGAIAVAPPDAPPLTPMPAPTLDSDVPESEETPNAAPTC